MHLLIWIKTHPRLYQSNIYNKKGSSSNRKKNLASENIKKKTKKINIRLPFFLLQIQKQKWFKNKFSRGLLDLLKTFSVHYSGAGFVVFVLCDPHFLEGRQATQNATTDPHTVFTFRRSHNFHSDTGWSQSSHFLGQT